MIKQFFPLNGVGVVAKEPETLNRIPGNRAVWVGIFSELTEFGLFFVIYVIAKAHYSAEFSQGPLALNTLAGTLNTVALITSSYFVAKAMTAIRCGKPKQSVLWLWGTVAAGVIYLLIKGWEYNWNMSHGIHSDTNPFFTLYYYMTFNHLLHVGWASCSILWAIYQINRGHYSTQSHAGLTAIACYWHMVDLAWIIIFPLLYVLR